MIVGLRVDVDTLRGTRRGVPRLLGILERRGIGASFFFSVGPDNMGRHLWRLRDPAFLRKMLRTGAPSLYGWDVLLRGTLWPGPRIGARCAAEIRATAAAGHEVGLHAWDHHAWQAHLDAWGDAEVRAELRRGYDALGEILGAPPAVSATPGWRCNERALRMKAELPFRYNSDCRGTSVFTPVLADGTVVQPQIPVTLPTYDEVVGTGGITDAEYNEHLLDLVSPEGLNVLAVHAEVEGIARAELFEDFVDRALARGVRFAPLGDLLRPAEERATAHLVELEVPGRAGLVACQVSG